MHLELPDGGSIDLPMEAMVIKDSLFVPTLKAKEMRAVLREAAAEIEIKLCLKTAIIDGYLGVLLRRVE